MNPYPFNVPPFPGRPSSVVTYPVGSIFPWYAADHRREAKEARKNPPEGWEYTGRMVKLNSNSTFNPAKSGVKYVLYLRKV